MGMGKCDLSPLKMYTVHMARYSASEARRQFFELLDAAERGEEVILDRKGIRFRLVVEPNQVVEPPTSPLIIDDPDVLSGEWTWVSDGRGQLQFQSTPSGQNST